MTTQVLTERHRRLGRHVEHDERSRAYVAEQSSKLRSVVHARYAPPFDQGNLGSCTAHAAFGLMVTEPLVVSGFDFGEKRIVDAYEWETAHDAFPGTYPPDDTGSSGLAAAKYLKHRGWIGSYRHAFGLAQALRALVLRPVITGVNWYDSFDRPDSHGHVSISPLAQVRGGHEFEVLGIDADSHDVRAVNSWGDQWGDHGYFVFAWEDWDRLLHEQGDVTTVHR